MLARLMISRCVSALVSFFCNEWGLTRANGTLDAWQTAEDCPSPRGSGVHVNVWVRDGDDLIHADAVAGRGRATRLRGVTIYERSGGRLDSILSAQTAAPVGQGWRLDKITRFTVASGKTETLP